MLTEQAERSGKPANIIERMIAGRLHKVMLADCVLYYYCPFVHLLRMRRQHDIAQSLVCTRLVYLCCIDMPSNVGEEENL